jgi:putative flippase GtrA
MSSPQAEWPGGICQLWQFALQYLRFGTVGAAATAVHVAVFVGLIELAGAPPLLANAIAFGLAVLISFGGHFHWTFAPRTPRATGIGRPARLALIRFFVVALIGLTLNSLAVYLVVNVLALPYGLAIVLMVTVGQAAVFTLSRLWAFA